MTADFIKRVTRMLCVFENDSGSPNVDYGAIYIYKDGKNHRRQVTLSSGFTDDGGSLREVVERYIAKKGARSELFKSRLSKFGRGVLVDDEQFIAALQSAASEKAMQEAQDEIFTEVYLQPALTWANAHWFILPLSNAVIVDSYLHSGGMLGWLMNEFPNKKPDNGGDEKDWITAYAKARLAWFKRASGPLHNTVYRPQFFLGEISHSNWDFNCPLVANGSHIC